MEIKFGIKAIDVSLRDADLPDEFKTLQKQLSQQWETRLDVMRDVFPWIRKEIQRIAGRKPGEKIEPGESVKAWFAIEDEYKLGTRSAIKEIRDLHIRQNEEWERLTGIQPLGTQNDWRQAGYASNAPIEVIQKCDVVKLAKFIVPWARNKLSAAQLSAIETTGNEIAKNEPQKTTQSPTEQEITKLFESLESAFIKLKDRRACGDASDARKNKTATKQLGFYSADHGWVAFKKSGRAHNAPNDWYKIPPRDQETVESFFSRKV